MTYGCKHQDTFLHLCQTKPCNTKYFSLVEGNKWHWRWTTNAFFHHENKKKLQKFPLTLKVMRSASNITWRVSILIPWLFMVTLISFIIVALVTEKERYVTTQCQNINNLKTKKSTLLRFFPKFTSFGKLSDTKTNINDIIWVRK